VLDVAEPEQRVLHVSFGSGAGSDAFCWRTLPPLLTQRGAAPTTRDYVARATAVDYATYLRYRGQIVME